MGRNLDDARALLDVDRERLAMMREAQAVNESALATAREVAQIGTQAMREAATFIAPGGGGPGIPILRTSSSGGGGATGGGSGGGGTRISDSRTLVSRGGGISQNEDFVREHCSMIPGGVEVPNPRNPFALVQGDMVTVPAWDCSVALGVPDAVFLDPDAMQAFRLPGMASSNSGRGAGGGGGGATGGRGAPTLGRRGPVSDVRNVGDGVVNPLTGSSTVGGSSGPTADGKLVAHAVERMASAVVGAIKDGGDLGLQIRRNGGI